MLTTAHVDMMGITFSSSFDEAHLHQWFGPFENVGSAKHGYTRRAVSEIGAVIVSDGPERLGKHLDVPGACLQAMRDLKMDVDSFPGFCLQHGGTATRLDLCVNLHDCDTNVDDLYERATLGQIRTRAELDKLYTGPKERGFYVGSKHSDRYMRVYDKRLEQRDPSSPPWVRIELQLRRRYAAAVMVKYTQHPNKRAFINRALKGYCDFPTSDEVQTAFHDQGGELPILPRKLPKFLKWLDEQIIPAMVKYQLENPESDVLTMVGLLYNQAYTKRAKK